MSVNNLVSVIVPVYNASAYIDECIKSVLAQSYANLELILVNDGSTDNSEEKCLWWKEKDMRIKYFNKENGGTASARNLGLSKSSGEYFCSLP